jgi:predicted Zn-dependent protease
VTPRTRLTATVAAAAVLAAGATVGATALQSRDDPSAAEPTARTLSGRPPFVVELGFRRDAEARRLRRAARAYGAGRIAEARRLLRVSQTLEAKVGLALAEWPRGTVGLLERLAAARPRSAVVQVNLGAALLWTGRTPEARAAWQRALRLEPDSPYAVRADDLLNLDTPLPGLPPVVTSAPFPAELRRLPPERQLRELARAARGGAAKDHLLYGIALQQAGRPLSARRELAAAARLAPSDPDVLTADAVSRFRKSQPAPAFARLGPLARRFPREPVVRLHLGLLLLWMGELDAARPQLERAASLGPGTVYGRQASRFAALLREK